MSDKIDIGEPVAEICERLGLDKNNVSCLDISSTSVSVVVFKLHNGAKYIGKDGRPAIETREFEVTTI